MLPSSRMLHSSLKKLFFTSVAKVKNVEYIYEYDDPFRKKNRYSY
jgi:hypothetical protein